LKKSLLCGLLIAVLTISTLNFAGIQPFIGKAAANNEIPAIQLVKSVNATAIHSGESVQYAFNVTNNGDATLYNVTVVDDTLDFVADPVIGPTVLAPGESSIALLNITIGGAPGILSNIANATGTTLNGITVVDVDAVSVRLIPYAPAILLEKSVNATSIYSGESVQYTFNVTNVGDSILNDVTVVDDTLDFVADPIMGPLTLAPGESSVALVNITVGGVGTLKNVANATGYSLDGQFVTDFDIAAVTIITPQVHPSLEVTKTGTPDTQLAPGTITWNVTVTNTGDVPLTNINVTDSRHGVLGSFSTLAPNATGFFTIVESNLQPGNYTDQAFAAGFFAPENLTVIAFSDPAVCIVKPVYILKQFTDVGVLPEGQSAGFNAELFNQTQVEVTGLKSGPFTYFYVTYYFENSVNFLGDNFDGQAHNFTLWDKWGSNLLALGSEPIVFDPTKNQNLLTLADASSFKIDPRLQGTDSYRGYIGEGLDISNLASQGEAWITMHLGDQQNKSNPGRGKGTTKDGTSYDADIVWYIGELDINQNATLTLIIAPGKNPGGQLLFNKLGYNVINAGPRLRAYANTYNDQDFLYSAQRTNTLTINVEPINN